MDATAISRTYARWAPIYDATFGWLTRRGRRRAVEYINAREGTVLELGVGTGLSLADYDRSLAVTGIDFSTDMLDLAREKVREQGLGHVRALRQMDARQLDFADESFDTVAAMHVLSVVPEPERVVAEIARVLRPGGEVVIVNHFARDTGFLAVVERLTAPLHDRLGWHSDFAMSRVLGQTTLGVAENRSSPPFGMMTFLVLRKAG